MELSVTFFLSCLSFSINAGATKAALHITPPCVTLERIKGSSVMQQGETGPPKSATENELLMGINLKQRDAANTNVHWHEGPQRPALSQCKLVASHSCHLRTLEITPERGELNRDHHHVCAIAVNINTAVCSLVFIPQASYVNCKESELHLGKQFSSQGASLPIRLYK